MSTLYVVNMFNTSGVQVSSLINWRNSQFTSKVNGVGASTLSIYGADPNVNLFELDNLIEVRRKPEGGSWYTENTYFHRSWMKETTERGDKIYSSYGKSLLDLIQRRCILYRATTANCIKSGPGETVIKEFVNENVGPGAISVAPLGPTERLSNGVTQGLTIEATAGRGLTWEGQRAWKNVLGVIQEIAESTDVDFDIVRTTLANFEFQCYYPQRGTDRRGDVVFALPYGNMTSPSYSVSRTDEATLVAVLGQDQGSKRKCIVRTSTAQADSPWNKIEQTLDARSEDSITYMQQDGDDKLEELKAQEKLSFEVLQTYSLAYGRDYFLGDLVTVVYPENTTWDMKITQADLQMNDDGRESIKLEFTKI